MTPYNFTGKVTVSQHAVDRVIERFGVEKTKAEQWVRDNVKKSRYVSTVLGEDGSLVRLFTFQRVAYLLNIEVDRVVTVYSRHYAPSDLSQRVRKLIMSELTKFERKEAVTERAVNVEKAKLAIEVAKCNYRMLVTPSKAVLRANTSRVRELSERIAELDRQLAAVRKEKSEIAKGLIPYL
ncbi:hypothetical protein [Paenibacillus pinihumi]|uniref:hypothetical protein n=1 Tax=Paenibacillus pinihumi TaxID=669462 RepID=UPI000490806F|nr:hypothetical protein [Paenibacillus pinihumi]